MTTIYSEGPTVEVIQNRPPPPPSVEPAWFTGQALNAWIPINDLGTGNAANGSRMMGMTDMAAIFAAGLCGPGPAYSAITDPRSGNGIGNPRGGIFNYSGGTFRTASSEMLVYGGGGAGAWAGNDIRGLSLDDDAPVWRVRKNPEPLANIPPRISGSTVYAYNWIGGAPVASPWPVQGAANCASPQARHSNWYQFFVDSQDKFYTFKGESMYQSDSGNFAYVDSVDWPTKTWALGINGAHPNLPGTLAWKQSGCCKHPVSEKVYHASTFSIQVFDPAANSWAQLGASFSFSAYPCVLCVDPVHDRMLMLVARPASPVFTIPLDGSTRTAATLVGPFASAIKPILSGVSAPGFVYDSALGCFLYFQDDGFIYTISYVSDSQWAVDRLTLAGTAPPVGSSSPAGAPPKIYGRMQYVAKYRGVCVVPAWNLPAYFVRTAA